MPKYFVCFEEEPDNSRIFAAIVAASPKEAAANFVRVCDETDSLYNLAHNFEIVRVAVHDEQKEQLGVYEVDCSATYDYLAYPAKEKEAQ